MRNHSHSLKARVKHFLRHYLILRDLDSLNYLVSLKLREKDLERDSLKAMVLEKWRQNQS